MQPDYGIRLFSRYINFKGNQMKQDQDKKVNAVRTDGLELVESEGQAMVHREGKMGRAGKGWAWKAVMQNKV